MVQEIEGQFQVGGTNLYSKTWLPDEGTPAVAKLVFIHGFSDHLGRYYGFFPYLASAGIAVYGFDQRGWGRSVQKPADRGLTGPTSQVLSDIAAFITHVASLPAPSSSSSTALPLFVMGHSMGGGEVLALASTPAYEASIVAHVRGWLLEAPFVAFDEREKPSTLKVFAGRLAGRLLPHMHLANPFPPESLTRDPAVQQSLREDDLCHDTGTLEGLAGLLDRTADLASGKYKLSRQVRSLWLGHGDQDHVTNYKESKRWFESQTALEDKTFKTYEGWLHQLHAEVGREEFYADVRKWLLERTGDDGGAAGGQKFAGTEGEAGVSATENAVKDGEALKADAKL
ncbi:Alpha/Beta hydrolase protein [Coniella lustricola]|uniref:Alpha/Beta hydrolase protein n=1 Tax=Coniella lustricola TaxID=2025994 RepID=A0A2T2ZXU1_9PEZI|nr:Alpha/Beta hydrolase protein [Coniella lustricola]